MLVECFKAHNDGSVEAVGQKALSEAREWGVLLPMRAGVLVSVQADRDMSVDWNSIRARLRAKSAGPAREPALSLRESQKEAQKESQKESGRKAYRESLKAAHPDWPPEQIELAIQGRDNLVPESETFRENVKRTFPDWSDKKVDLYVAGR